RCRPLHADRAPVGGSAVRAGTRVVRSCRGARRTDRGIHAVVSEFLDLGRGTRHPPRGPLCASRTPAGGTGTGPVGRARRRMRPSRIHPPGMVGVGLEHPGDRLLPVPRSGTDGHLDRLPPVRTGTARNCRDRHIAARRAPLMSVTPTRDGSSHRNPPWWLILTSLLIADTVYGFQQTAVTPALPVVQQYFAASREWTT